MTTQLLTRVLGLTLFLTPAAATPAMATRLAPAASQVSTLRGYTDSTLESFRAGYASAPTPLAGQVRAELATAQQNSASLAELRGGGLSDKEITWLLIGAAVVLLIILL